MVGTSSCHTLGHIVEQALRVVPGVGHLLVQQLDGGGLAPDLGLQGRDPRPVRLTRVSFLSKLLNLLLLQLGARGRDAKSQRHAGGVVLLGAREALSFTFKSPGVPQARGELRLGGAGELDLGSGSLKYSSKVCAVGVELLHSGVVGVVQVVDVVGVGLRQLVELDVGQRLHLMANSVVEVRLRVRELEAEGVAGRREVLQVAGLLGLELVVHDDALVREGGFRLVGERPRALEHGSFKSGGQLRLLLLVFVLLLLEVHDAREVARDVEEAPE